MPTKLISLALGPSLPLDHALPLWSPLAPYVVLKALEESTAPSPAGCPSPHCIPFLGLPPNLVPSSAVDPCFPALPGFSLQSTPPPTPSPLVLSPGTTSRAGASSTGAQIKAEFFVGTRCLPLLWSTLHSPSVQQTNGKSQDSFQCPRASSCKLISHLE